MLSCLQVPLDRHHRLLNNLVLDGLILHSILKPVAHGYGWPVIFQVLKLASALELNLYVWLNAFVHLTNLVPVPQNNTHGRAQSGLGQQCVGKSVGVSANQHSTPPPPQKK